MHHIRHNNYKFLLILLITLVFLISSCSKPSENNEDPAKKTPEIVEPEKKQPVQEKETKIETPKPETAPVKPEPTKPESVKPEPVKLEPVKPEPAKPVPVAPKPAKEAKFTDIIKMENPAYEKHKKGIVLFTHKRHVDDYKIDCGQCHHDENGMPLNDLKKDGQVDACIVCHTKTGQAPRPKDKTKLTLKEKREYHAEAIHQNCISCHKEYNKKNNTKAAPASCSKCHPKGE